LPKGPEEKERVAAECDESEHFHDPGSPLVQ
jgi:hypothetical protein